MDFDLWWLLPIPAVFFGLGWIAARIDIKHLLTESRALPLSYFRGLNFLLNEQPDKAIESFIEVVKVDPETVDLHFALGNLFRRQGEVERAIRMHQNLLDRSDLPQDRRTMASYELAQDFLRAGMLDRAERLFATLEGTAYETRSLRHLISIYEQEKDWAKAIAVTGRVAEIERSPAHREIAQYHCELAQAALVNSDLAAARAGVDSALAVHRGCARANVLAGDLAMQQGDPAGAIDAWQRIGTQNAAFLALVADRVADACRKLGDRPRAIRLLRAWQEQSASLDILKALFSVVLEAEGAEAAAALIKDELARNPTLLGLDRLLEAQIQSAPPERRHDLELVRGLVSQHIKRLGMYRCEQCGFRARQYYWRCPGCQKWETYSPKRTETPEGFT
ncbi:Lipopolysaccharide assembly protein B [Burkholderiales bacterium]|nr:Lipopolysaccharide assembly protein B [Burkholderiales bacterium]